MTQIVTQFRWWGLCMGVMLWLLPAGHAAAQTSTATLQGTVTEAGGEPLPGATVRIRNTETGFVRGALTNESGFYSIVGIIPGPYEITVSYVSFQDRTLQRYLPVGQVVSINTTLSAADVTIDEVVIAGNNRTDLVQAEVGANVTQQQIQSLPLLERNFISLAQLVPGVRIDPNQPGRVRVGGGRAENVNVFIDGVSYKSDIQPTGVVGVDAALTNGANPFPQLAVGEFRVVTQGFKAEFQRASTALINATTVSGTNELEQYFFAYYQGSGMQEPDFFTERAINRGDVDEPEFSRLQVGYRVTGPIIKDKLHYALVFEGNYADLVRSVGVASPRDTSQLITPYRGTFELPVRSTNLFAKISWNASERHLFEFSGTVRYTDDERDFGEEVARERFTLLKNTTYTGAVRHLWTIGSRLTNEATLSYQKATFSFEPGNTNGLAFSVPGPLNFRFGNNVSLQDKTQNRLAFTNVLTYVVGKHTIKGGGNMNYALYDITQANRFVPEYQNYNINQVLALPALNTNTIQTLIPGTVEVGVGNPSFQVVNWQLGAFLQDDWAVTQRLNLSFGVRWDVETNMFNNGFVTPAEVRTQLAAVTDTRNIVTNGRSDRPVFHAIQPRVGASYDVTGDQSTIVFGSFGVFYDRSPFDFGVGERLNANYRIYQLNFRNEAVGDSNGIAWSPSFYNRDFLINYINSNVADADRPTYELLTFENDIRPPRQNHWTFGVRQRLSIFQLEMSYVAVRGFNDIAFSIDNRVRDYTPPAGIRNVLVLRDGLRNWYDALLVKLDKGYTEESGWGVGISYTLGYARSQIDNATDGFGYLTFDLPESRSSNDERHRIVANFIVDLPLKFQLSGLLTLGSGVPINAVYGGAGPFGVFSQTFPNPDNINLPDPVNGERNTVDQPKAPFVFRSVFAYRNLDLTLRKWFNIADGRYRIGIRLDGFNVFNVVNYSGFDAFIADYDPLDRQGGGPGIKNRNANFGNPNSTFPGFGWQFGIDFDF